MNNYYNNFDWLLDDDAKEYVRRREKRDEYLKKAEEKCEKCEEIRKIRLIYDEFYCCYKCFIRNLEFEAHMKTPMYQVWDMKDYLDEGEWNELWEDLKLKKYE